MPDFLRPEAFPPRVRAAVSPRAGGVSRGRYASLNLGDHVGDNPARVAENRRRVRRMFDLPGEPRWLEQVHGSSVAREAAVPGRAAARADAAVTREPGVVLAVLTADCLPVLVASRDASEVAVAHAGWRGLAAGVLEAALAAMDHLPADLVAWLGPAIGAEHYEVDGTVREAFAAGPGMPDGFRPSGRRGHWQCDLAALARARLAAAGVARVSGGKRDTFAEPARFFSFRREGETGRMAAFIWRDAR